MTRINGLLLLALIAACRPGEISDSPTQPDGDASTGDNPTCGDPAQCADGETCSDGVCVCPVGQVRCSNGTCAVECQPPDPTSDDLTCDDPVYGMVRIPATDVISDFVDPGRLIRVVGGRGVGADPWHAYAAGDVTDPVTNQVSEPSISNPLHANNLYEVDMTTSGPCGQGGSLRVKTPGNTEWGMGFGIDFMARDSQFKKLSYDASAYTGIGFWARATNDVRFAYFKAVDAVEDGDAVEQSCSYSQAPFCNQFGIKNATITKNWTYYKMYFDELTQDPAVARFSTAVDKSKLTAFQIHVNATTDRQGVGGANDFELWIDDVHFLTEPRPQVPTTPVTFTTPGNKLMRNGVEHRIRGLVRPSMEWDMTGFGISREDIQRMKVWGANTIRLAVLDRTTSGDDYWGSELYRRNVKRAVSWILSEDMDAIIDLHYVGTVPTTANTAFWESIAADAFYRNGRIIFELYNEPAGIDAASLKDWMQRTTTAIRNQGANNLILVGAIDYSYDIRHYVANPVTGGPIAYVTHPYKFKTQPSHQEAYIVPSRTIPVVATEFGDANVPEIGNGVGPDQCEPQHNQRNLTDFEANGVSWTAWAWIVDGWGCGFPQLLLDYSGEPNAIGQPILTELQSHGY